MTAARTDLIEALAKEIGASPLTEPEIDSILELAAVAAHGTGDRTSAPLASFLAGIVAARAQSRVDSIERVRQHTDALTARPDS